jgi:hypothetical protein
LSNNINEITKDIQERLEDLHHKLKEKQITFDEYSNQSQLLLEEQQKRYDKILKIDRSKKVEEQKEQKEKPSIKYSIGVWFASYMILSLIVIPIFAINFEHLIGIGIAILCSTSAIISAIYSRRAGYSVVLFCIFLPAIVMGISNPSFSDGEQETKSEQVVEKKEETKDIYTYTSDTTETVSQSTYGSYKSCFSNWDGAHREVKEKLKSQFNEYDHIATRYFTNYSDYLMVKTEFNATDLYGNKIMYYAEAKVAKDSSCTVYSLNLY